MQIRHLSKSNRPKNHRSPSHPPRWLGLRDDQVKQEDVGPSPGARSGKSFKTKRRNYTSAMYLGLGDMNTGEDKLRQAVVETKRIWHWSMVTLEKN